MPQAARNSVPEPEDKNKDKKDAQLAASWIRQYTLVFEFLAALALLGYLGHHLDERYGWQPWGLLTGLLLGMVLGLYRMVRASR